MQGNVLSKEDFQMVRGVLRWAAMGVQPAIAIVNSLKEVVGAVKDQSLDSVKAVSEDLARGVMVSREGCKSALSELQAYFYAQRLGDDDTAFEAHRG